MDNEIREYEFQLKEVKDCIKVANEDERKELQLLEQEIIDLLEELRSKLPKFKLHDEIATNTVLGKISAVLGSKSYKIQIFDENGKSTDSELVILESDMWKKQLPRPAAQKEEGTNVVSDEFEENKQKWKKFSKGPKGGVSKLLKSTKLKNIKK